MIQVKFKVFNIGLLVWALSLTAVPKAGHAQKPDKGNPVSDSVNPPEGGKSLIPPTAVQAFKVEAPAGSTEIKELPVQGQPFSNALRVQTNKRLPNEEDSRLYVNTVSGFAGGDVIFVRLYARLIKTQDETGEGVIALTLRQYDPNDPKGRQTAAFFPKRFTFNEQWQHIDLPIPTRRGLKAGQARFIIGVGGTQPQTIEIGGAEVINYKNKVKEQNLPFTSKSYEGRDINAAWRKEAADRIEKYRKGDVSIEVTDAAGKPVKGAAIELTMQRHAFGFGTEVNSAFLAQSADTSDGLKYREAIKKHFNQSVVCSGLKWMTWTNPQLRQAAIETVKWLRDSGLTIRGHCLVWPNWKNLPQSVQALKDNPEALRKKVREHVVEEVGAFKGQLIDWDVTNETFASKDLMNILGKEEMVEWYKLARQADPTVKLYINENSVLTGRKLDFYLQEIQYLIDHKAPLDGIGEQGHMSPMDIKQVWKNLEKLAKFNLPIKITEFDVVTPDEQLQADWTRDFLTLIFSHPMTGGFVMWGFWDGKHWLNDAPIYYKDWSLKPSGQVWIDLTTKQWWTNLKGQSDAAGTYKNRGFAGSYEVTLKSGSKTKTVKFDLPKEGKVVKVVMD